MRTRVENVGRDTAEIAADNRNKWRDIENIKHIQPFSLCDAHIPNLDVYFDIDLADEQCLTKPLAGTKVKKAQRII